MIAFLHLASSNDVLLNTMLIFMLLWLLYRYDTDESHLIS